MLRLAFEDPDDLSPMVADLHRRWYRAQGLTTNRLVVSSFVLIEPHGVLRTGSVPFWATFNAGPTCARLNAYLERAEPYDEIRLMIFPHGTESVGLPSLDDWRRILRRARREGGFLGVNERAYPYHFSALARYHTDLADIPASHPAPPPMPLDELERFCAAAGKHHTVRLLAA